MNAGESQPIFSVGFGMAAEIRDERARPEAWLERELDAFWAEEQERAAAETHTRQIRAKAKAKRARTQKRPQT